MTVTTYPEIYSLEMLRDEAHGLVESGKVNRQQPIYTLCQFIPEREWECIEINLEENEFLLRNKIIDLLAQERWDED